MSELEKYPTGHMSGSLDAKEVKKAQTLKNPALANRVEQEVRTIHSTIQRALPYIIELRKRFAALPRGKANIKGCRTWTEFCERRLHRTDRHIRRVIAEALAEEGEERTINVVASEPPKERARDVAVRDGHISVNEAATQYGVPSEEINKKLSRGGGLPAVASDTTNGAKHYDRRNDEYRDEYTDADTAEKEPKADPKKKFGKYIRKLVVRTFPSVAALVKDLDYLEDYIFNLLPDDLLDDTLALQQVVVELRRIARRLECAGLEEERQMIEDAEDAEETETDADADLGAIH
jgi:hypothetical protein